MSHHKEHDADLEVKRKHSASHIMTAAVQMMFGKEIGLGVGPWTDDGFYQDFDFGDKTVTDKDFKEIEKKMRWIVNKDMPIKKAVVKADEARKICEGDPYKTELIEEIIARGEDISFYYIGESLDKAISVNLCAGPHLTSTGELGAFKLMKTAGAYWRGDEKNKMLTRIYGVAFAEESQIDDYLNLIEEAKKRDHRKLGKELELFTFSDIVGAGLPIWLPKGSTIRRELERFVVDTELEWGYLHVHTPDIAKLELYKKSGHYPYYKDSMYAPIKIDDDEFMLRPMTCPHHFQVYSDKPRSYRELPMRIAELAKLYRYESSGELTGLIRVRGFCLADAHIICADKEQAATEIGRALDLIEYVCTVFGLTAGEDYWYRLSLGDRADEKKYYKNDNAWNESEDILRDLLLKRGSKFFEAPQEAAFYGPKIDIQMRNVRGKEDTAFTVQYDFCMPDRFDLNYIAADGSEKRAIVVHRSSIGAIERIVAFLIERYAGNFPTWLSPVQAVVLPIGEKHAAFADDVVAQLKKAGIRVELSEATETLGKRVRTAKMQKVPYMLVIGDAEVDAASATLEHRGLGKIGTFTIEDIIKRLTQEITTRALNP